MWPYSKPQWQSSRAFTVLQPPFPRRVAGRWQVRTGARLCGSAVKKERSRGKEEEGSRMAFVINRGCSTRTGGLLRGTAERGVYHIVLCFEKHTLGDVVSNGQEGDDRSQVACCQICHGCTFDMSLSEAQKLRQTLLLSMAVPLCLL